jgi:hypothetical protein
LINNFKLENNKDFESKFKHIINSVKNNYKIIIKQEDQVNNLETLLNSTPFVPPKSLAKERFPLPHFNKEKSFLPKHEECTVKCQKLYMQLSIDHLNESIEATKKRNLDIKNQLDPEFKDLLYLKSTFKLECIEIDGFFDEMKSQAAKLVQADLLKRDNKTKNTIAHANANASAQETSSSAPASSSSTTNVTSTAAPIDSTPKSSPSTNQNNNSQHKNKHNDRRTKKRTTQSSTTASTTSPKDSSVVSQKPNQNDKANAQHHQQQQPMNQNQRNQNASNNNIHPNKRSSKSNVSQESSRNQSTPQHSTQSIKQNLPKQNYSTNPHRTHVQPLLPSSFPNFAFNNGFQSYMPQNFQWAPPFPQFR